MNNLIYTAQQIKYSSSHTTMAQHQKTSMKKKVILTAPSDFNFCSRLLEVW